MAASVNGSVSTSAAFSLYVSDDQRVSPDVIRRSRRTASNDDLISNDSRNFFTTLSTRVSKSLVSRSSSGKQRHRTACESTANLFDGQPFDRIAPTDEIEMQVHSNSNALSIAFDECDTESENATLSAIPTQLWNVPRPGTRWDGDVQSPVAGRQPKREASCSATDPARKSFVDVRERQSLTAKRLRTDAPRPPGSGVVYPARRVTGSGVVTDSGVVRFGRVTARVPFTAQSCTLTRPLPSRLAIGDVSGIRTIPCSRPLDFRFCLNVSAFSVWTDGAGHQAFQDPRSDCSGCILVDLDRRFVVRREVMSRDGISWLGNRQCCVTVGASYGP